MQTLKALAFVRVLVGKMQMDVEANLAPERRQGAADEIRIEIEEPDSGRIIGKKASVLDAIQYLTARVVGVPAGSHRRPHHRRRRGLSRPATRTSWARWPSDWPSVSRPEGKVIWFDPMSARERRIVHVAPARHQGRAPREHRGGAAAAGPDHPEEQGAREGTGLRSQVAVPRYVNLDSTTPDKGLGGILPSPDRGPCVAGGVGARRKVRIHDAPARQRRQGPPNASPARHVDRALLLRVSPGRGARRHRSRLREAHGAAVAPRASRGRAGGSSSRRRRDVRPPPTTRPHGSTEPAGPPGEPRGPFVRGDAKDNAELLRPAAGDPATWWSSGGGESTEATDVRCHATSPRKHWSMRVPWDETRRALGRLRLRGAGGRRLPRRGHRE